MSHHIEESVCGHKISASSNDTVHEGLDLFASEDTCQSVLSGNVSIHKPTRDNTDVDVEFTIPASEMLYTDLAKSRMTMEVIVTKQDGSALANNTTDNPYWMGDNFAHSLFESVSLEVNGKIVESSANYALLSAVEMLCDTTNETRTHRRWIEGWIEDGCTTRDEDFAEAASITERKRIISGKRRTAFWFQPNLEFLKQNRYIAPGAVSYTHLTLPTILLV